MAVQAQYPSNVLLLGTRGEQERKEMDYPQAPPGFLDQSAVFFSDGVNGNPRKRGRELAAVPMAAPAQQNHPISLFSLQSQPCSTPLPLPTVISLTQLQSQTPPLVSTGLRLAFEDQQQQHQEQNQNQYVLSSSSSSLPFSSFLSEELATEINKQKDEIEQFLHAQGEQLRRALAERRQRHYRALLGAVEESAARRLREKEAEVERAARRRAELEDRLARLRTESMAWQAKAMAEQAAAASLHAQLQQAAAAAAALPHGKAEECGGELPAEDAQSAHVDPDRVDPERACRACRYRPVSVVLLPCRHLCLCSACAAAAASDACPVCRCLRTGSVQVFFS
ncbi:BOI-related E3 ubiquitin-protein ligase 1-like [Phoenix dactylifera]|uniref:BOI-related E3 ubiquitin-protein ligase 1-like n=1 Tax=Phoenix dactylifera TaxID=42345 RepID=A0A8B7BVI5_PHODC|nr:BOI-related E3 ubiquitin-protein ligase 1-like [Phoenix dactylifera]